VRMLWLLSSYPSVGALAAAESVLEITLRMRQSPQPAPATDAVLSGLLAVASPESGLGAVGVDGLSYLRTRTRTPQSSRKLRTRSQPS
jgi:hypothetical protein